MNKFVKLSTYIWGVALVIVAILYIIHINISSAETRAYVNKSDAIKSQISKVHSLTTVTQGKVTHQLNELSDLRTLGTDLKSHHGYLIDNVTYLKKKLKDMLIEIKQHSKSTKGFA